MVLLSLTTLLSWMVATSSTAAFQTQRPNRFQIITPQQKQWSRRAAEASFTKIFLSDSDDGVSAMR